MVRTSRRVVAVIVLLALLGFPLLAAPSLRAPQPAAAQSTPPSILVIQTDDMRADDLAAMPKTLAALQARGLSFDNYIAGGTPLCCPNRATALTGLYPHNHGVLHNGGPTGGHQAFRGRGNEGRTIAVALDAAGYTTAYLGKYMNGYPSGKKDRRQPAGWDQWHAIVMDGANDCGACGGGKDGFYYTYKLNQNGTQRAYGDKRQDYSTSVLKRKALSLIEGTDPETPLFIWVSPMAPHGPSIPAPGDGKASVPLGFKSEAFNHNGTGKASWIRKLPKMNAPLVRYIEDRHRERRRSLLEVDEMVEQLVTAMPDGSYIFFFSDNGYMLGEHRIANGKFVPYKPSAEVPLLVAGPGVAPSTTRPEITSSVDLAATFAEIGGTTMATDGVSLLPLLHGATPAWRDSVLIEWDGSIAASQQADLDGDILPASVVADEARANRTDPQAANDKNGKREGKKDKGRKRPDRERDNEINKRSYRAPAYNALRGATWLYIEWKGGFREYYDHAAGDEDEINNIYGELTDARQEELATKVQSMKTCSGAQCN